MNNLCCKKTKKKKCPPFLFLNNLFLYSLHTHWAAQQGRTTVRDRLTQARLRLSRRPSGCCCCHPLWHSSRSRFICLGLVLARSSSYSHWKRAKTTFHHTQEQKNCPINLISFFSANISISRIKNVFQSIIHFFDLSIFIVIQGQSVVKDLVSYLYFSKRGSRWKITTILWLLSGSWKATHAVVIIFVCFL